VVGRPTSHRREAILVLADPNERSQRLNDARSGTAAQVWVLVLAYRDYLLRLSADRLSPALRAKAGPSDLVSDTLVEAYQSFAAFRGRTEGEFVAWLRRLLVHNLANFERRYVGTAMRQVGRETRLSARPDAAAVADPGRSPSALVVAGEQAARVRAGLDQLAPDHRAVIVWHNMDGLPFDEIGRRMNRTTDAARHLWARAIDQLQRTLARTPR
jgi:RNA polymerase sigma-70 factor (ECF subfamily)